MYPMASSRIIIDLSALPYLLMFLLFSEEWTEIMCAFDYFASSPLVLPKSFVVLI